ncbi:hypothetical protein [Caballeronia sp. LZ043]|uniref:hypothetical protein n=1 Tax=Caballeronia sp. LZ043 TaxID=3038569 RepID=UPI002857BB39|nr:hypothetical protein [Caballeronia sp. LZ043]MDR5825847.1 hypothetical protein [Caballeronia sp. LZ043]
MRTIQPMRLNFQVPMIGIFVERWPYRHRNMKPRVTEQKNTDGMVYGLRRITEKDAAGRQYRLEVLACIKPGLGGNIPKEKWVTDDIAWVKSLYAMNCNPKSVGALAVQTLEEFRESTDYEWLAADAPVPPKRGDAA